jgi:universal stress protein A
VIKKILVPTDFSVGSNQAFVLAAQWAETFGASIALIHVIPFPQTGDGREMTFIPYSTLLEEAHARLDEDKARVSVSCEAYVTLGNTRDEIVRNAVTLGVDLIVMATHGRRGLAHFFMGSVAESVLRAAPCPVLSFHPRASDGQALPKEAPEEAVKQ